MLKIYLKTERPYSVIMWFVKYWIILYFRFPVRISISDSSEGSNVVFGSSLNGISVTDVTLCRILRDTENSKMF